MMEINILSHCKEFIPNPCPDSCMRGSNLQGPILLLLLTLLLQQLTAYHAAAVRERMSKGHCTCEGHIYSDLWQHIANTQEIPN